MDSSVDITSDDERPEVQDWEQVHNQETTDQMTYCDLINEYNKTINNPDNYKIVYLSDSYERVRGLLQKHFREQNVYFFCNLGAQEISQNPAGQNSPLQFRNVSRMVVATDNGSELHLQRMRQINFMYVNFFIFDPQSDAVLLKRLSASNRMNKYQICNQINKDQTENLMNLIYTSNDSSYIDSQVFSMIAHCYPMHSQEFVQLYALQRALKQIEHFLDIHGRINILMEDNNTSQNLTETGEQQALQTRFTLGTIKKTSTAINFTDKRQAIFVAMQQAMAALQYSALDQNTFPLNQRCSFVSKVMLQRMIGSHFTTVRSMPPPDGTDPEVNRNYEVYLSRCSEEELLEQCEYLLRLFRDINPIMPAYCKFKRIVNGQVEYIGDDFNMLYKLPKQKTDVIFAQQVYNEDNAEQHTYDFIVTNELGQVTIYKQTEADASCAEALFCLVENRLEQYKQNKIGVYRCSFVCSNGATMLTDIESIAVLETPFLEQIVRKVCLGEDLEGFVAYRSIVLADVMVPINVSSSKGDGTPTFFLEGKEMKQE